MDSWRKKRPMQDTLSYWKVLRTYLCQGAYKRPLALTVLCVFLNKLCIACGPFAFRWAMESLKLTDGIGIASVAIFFYLLARCLATIFGDGKDLFFVPLEQSMIARLAEDIFDHMQRLSLSFHINRKTGGLMRALEKGVKAIEIFFRYFIFNIIPTLLEVFLVCGALWIFYPPFFAITLFLTLIGYGLFTFIVSERRLQILHEINRLDRGSRSKFFDNMLNYATVKYFHQEPQERTLCRAYMQDVKKLNIKMRFSLVFLNIGQALILCVGLAALLMRAAFCVMDQTMTLADFVLMNVVILQFIMPLHALGFAYREIKQSLIDIQQMIGVFSLPLETQDEGDAFPLRLSQGAVSFHNVTFGYDPERPVLKNCSFEIQGGARVAFVGPSGAGKSTVFSLLVRFFEPQSGSILIDGQDLAHITRYSLRNAIGVVPQDSILFNETVFYNIAYGSPDASFERVVQAAKKACVHDFIMTLAKGYDTPVGERGLKLSGGEKQRLAIARALLKNPSIFFFDEATSALDNQTERAIQRDVFSLTAHKTTLIIAHRLSTIINVDRIFVFHEGRVFEQGTHQELLALGGLYAQLWHQQHENL
jgi:ABC-type transport system involved in Fe-S cluster assembly fused permease/ATPase subunit